MKKVALSILGILLFAAFVKYVALSHSGACKDLEEKARGIMSQSLSCSSDVDCKTVSLTCPFECFNSFGKHRVEEIMDAVKAYNKQCLYNCPMCPNATSERAVCRQGMCVLE